MPNFIENILGANWRTTLAGLAAAVLSAYKEGGFTDPFDWQKWIIPVAFAVFGFLTKDKQVTGGSVQQTPKGKVLRKVGTIIVAFLMPAFLLGGTMTMIGCANSGSLSADAQAAAGKVGADALKALQDFVLKEALDWLSQHAGSNTADKAVASTTAKAQSKFPSIPPDVAAAETKAAYQFVRKNPPRAIRAQ